MLNYGCALYAGARYTPENTVHDSTIFPSNENNMKKSELPNAQLWYPHP